MLCQHICRETTCWKACCCDVGAACQGQQCSALCSNIRQYVMACCSLLLGCSCPTRPTHKGAGHMLTASSYPPKPSWYLSRYHFNIADTFSYQCCLSPSTRRFTRRYPPELSSGNPFWCRYHKVATHFTTGKSGIHWIINYTLPGCFQLVFLGVKHPFGW